MKHSVLVTLLACIGAFFTVGAVFVLIEWATGWKDPKDLGTFVAAFAAIVTWHEARP